MINASRFSNSHWDAMRDAVVSKGHPEIVVTREALETFLNGALVPTDAPAVAFEAADQLARAARATPADDGVVTLTARILACRDWSVVEHGE